MSSNKRMPAVLKILQATDGLTVRRTVAGDLRHAVELDGMYTGKWVIRTAKPTEITGGGGHYAYRVYMLNFLRIPKSVSGVIYGFFDDASNLIRVQLMPRKCVTGKAVPKRGRKMVVVDLLHTISGSALFAADDVAAACIDAA